MRRKPHWRTARYRPVPAGTQVGECGPVAPVVPVVPRRVAPAVVVGGANLGSEAKSPRPRSDGRQQEWQAGSSQKPLPGTLRCRAGCVRVGAVLDGGATTIKR